MHSTDFSEVPTEIIPPETMVELVEAVRGPTLDYRQEVFSDEWDDVPTVREVG